MKLLSVLTLGTFILSNTPVFAKSALPEDGSGRAKALTPFAHNAFMSTTQRNHLKVVIQKNEDAPVNLSLFDEDRNLVFSTTISENAALKPLNLTNLASGSYLLELKRGSQVENSKVVVK